MRVTSVDLLASNSSFITLSFRDPSRQNPYNVRSIDGLDADEIIPRYYGASGGQKFYDLSPGQRDIIVVVDLNPISAGQTFSSLRDALYKLISSSRTGAVSLVFKNELGSIAGVSGFITRFEAPKFTQSPQVKITISCDDAMLRALTPVVIPTAGLDPAATTINDILSTAPHGFKFQMTFSANVPVFHIEDEDATWGFEVNPTYNSGFLSGDVLHFSSEHNDKYLYVVRGGVTTHIADAIIPGSVWPILFPGENTFAVDDAASMAWSAISHRPSYWGV